MGGGPACEVSGGPAGDVAVGGAPAGDVSIGGAPAGDVSIGVVATGEVATGDVPGPFPLTAPAMEGKASPTPPSAIAPTTNTRRLRMSCSSWSTGRNRIGEALTPLHAIGDEEGCKEIIAAVVVPGRPTAVTTVAIRQDGRMARSKNTQFAVAVHVLTYLAGETGGRPVSSEELSGSTNVNPVYVRRVLGPLREAGLVRSRPGAHGGWELASAAEDITLARVWRLLQGTDPVLGLHGPDPSCAVGRSVQKSLTALDLVVGDAVATELERFTVHDVLTQGVEHPARQAVGQAGPGSRSERGGARAL